LTKETERNRLHGKESSVEGRTVPQLVKKLPSVHYRLYKSTAFHVPSQLYPVVILTPFFNIRLNIIFLSVPSRDGSVGVATGYGLNDQGIKVQFLIGMSRPALWLTQRRIE
jgi:hypothetical protein